MPTIEDDFIKLMELTNNDAEGFGKFIDALNICGYKIVKIERKVKDETND